MMNAINWFEIPVRNFERAKAFYENIFQTEMPISELPEHKIKMAFFNYEMIEGAVGGAIAKGPKYRPSKVGALVYLNGGNDLNNVLSRVADAGGEVVMEKTSLGQNGFTAQFIDVEGNKIALHSRF